MKKLLLYIFFGFASLSCMAHTGIGATQKYGNVHVHSYKETNREDFKKAFIIGQLANKLAQELKYNEPIFLDCWLGIVNGDTVATDYQVSVQNYKARDEDGSELETLIIKQQAQYYDVIETLKLVEYAIKNKKAIKKQQQWIKSSFFYDRGAEKQSISNTVIHAALRQPISNVIKTILQTRINRPLLPEERKQDISYYWQNNQYHIYRNMKVSSEKEARDVVLLTLPHLYEFNDLDLVFLIFDTVSSFYYININQYERDSGINKVSTHHVIKDIGKLDFGKKITSISHGDVSIYINQGMIRSGETRLLLYFYETDTLIQDAYTALGISSTALRRIQK